MARARDDDVGGQVSAKVRTSDLRVYTDEPLLLHAGQTSRSNLSWTRASATAAVSTTTPGRAQSRGEGGKDLDEAWIELQAWMKKAIATGMEINDIVDYVDQQPFPLGEAGMFCVAYLNSWSVSQEMAPLSTIFDHPEFQYTFGSAPKRLYSTKSAVGASTLQASRVPNSIIPSEAEVRLAQMTNVKAVGYLLGAIREYMAVGRDEWEDACNHVAGFIGEASNATTTPTTPTAHAPPTREQTPEWVQAFNASPTKGIRGLTGQDEGDQEGPTGYTRPSLKMANVLEPADIARAFYKRVTLPARSTAGAGGGTDVAQNKDDELELGSDVEDE
ncbi:hypothetical protein CF326_g9404, partial [Tilletia indica]